MIRLEAIEQARRALGRQLAAHRQAAGYNQTTFAPLTAYSRSTIANVETGRQHVPRDFWERCDQLLRTGGTLAAGYDKIQTVVRRQYEEEAQTTRVNHEADSQEWPGRLPELAGLRSMTSESGTAPKHTASPIERETASAIRRTFLHVASASHTAVPVEPNPDNPHSLENHVLNAWQHRQHPGPDEPLLVLVSGFAGSGKTEFGRFLSSVTRWPLLDKDILTRPLTENLLVSLGGDPNDRHTSLYSGRVRPLEYRCLLGTAFENLDRGISTVLTAPFLSEVSYEPWVRRLVNRCTAKRAEVAIIWVECDVDSMHDYLQFRGAARDAWKMTSWDDYLASIDLALRPQCPHFVVDNRLNATMSLADQARDLASRVRT